MNDDERFRRLYGDTARRIYGFLRRRCDHDTAESVLSEVYLKA